ncbi:MULTISPECIES: MBL fold metallo-hydrolase [unclassified Hyphomonas]|jgi:hydroxyacylglutathione hydrolase|uniref:MBL fold metallo-hydrolase n=2 Tax=Hyphomonas TaxID=85 RepID=UPI000C91201F|nr:MULTISPECIES: MBL fold metallo-hydrolase [unclassified Hyphomonas]MAL46561.1 MBL fold metallo-hydrolase [Hyphomonas sp.]HBJ40090.1 MBL fold metallo-hydrolase [Hyphomonas sp.]HBN93002.1 MBL fold metallo-hydrolase [Hyphomonas sp.]HBT38254.1 MBL fold metallo-hydrolase [Hyphomonas sp.]HBU35124.1 MBL fold metallo-hydrolase [Hyphomonas sp.]|tara:strand:- start:7500 stop:8864 length:1365 start_codon:yes stop_codon:yes gene_type:complete
MYLERIETTGLAHFSYLICDGGVAAVIDPRRDVDIYLEIARRESVEIRHIFETHRNEDLISGAATLSKLTGARVYHGPNPAGHIAYADIVSEPFHVAAGNLRLEVLETPGHTDDSISIAIYDEAYPDGAVGVFTGDALFVGDVGRTDFYQDREAEMAGKLWDSLQKLLALGDQVIVYPAHGAGSVCGSGVAERAFSTLGHERRNNRRLSLASREAFVAAKTAEHHYQPPYFSFVERLNLEGAAPRNNSFSPPILSLKDLRAREPDHLIDIRSVTGFLGGHVEGAQALPVSMISAFAGWYIGEAETIGLIADRAEDVTIAINHLGRIGFDQVIGATLNPLAMAASGTPLKTVPIVDLDTVAERTKTSDGWTLLDVRSIEEFEAGHVPGASHFYVGDVLAACDKPDLSGPATIMCGSGARATVAASALLRCGYTDIDVFIGSFKAWQAAGKSVEGA